MNCEQTFLKFTIHVYPLLKKVRIQVSLLHQKLAEQEDSFSSTYEFISIMKLHKTGWKSVHIAQIKKELKCVVIGVCALEDCFYPLKTLEGYSFGIIRASVRNHISVTIGQI